MNRRGDSVPAGELAQSDKNGKKECMEKVMKKQGSHLPIQRVVLIHHLLGKHQESHAGVLIPLGD